MRIAFYLPRLALDGAERPALFVAQEIQRRGHDVRLIINRPEAGDTAASVRVEVLGADGVFAGAALGKMLAKQPADVLIAVTTQGIVTAALAKRLGLLTSPLLGWEQNILSSLAKSGGASALLARLTPLLYGACDKVVFPSNGAAQDAIAFCAPRPIRAIHVYNCAPTPLWAPPSPAEAQIEASLQAPRLVATGPLTADRDHLTLLRAFQIFARVNGGSLLIIGEGERRAALETAATGLGLGKRVVFAGAAVTAANLLNFGDMFVSSSAVDASGESIVEALALGLPVVAVDCPTAPREILADGRFGRLAVPGNPRALWHAMRDALADAPDREALRRRAGEFSAESAADAFLALLNAPQAEPVQTVRAA